MRIKAFAIGALGALSVLVAAAIVIPQYSDYTAAAIASEVVAVAGPLREKIEATIQQQKSPTMPAEAKAWRLDSPRVVKSEVLSNGVLVLQLDGKGQVIVFIPTFADGKVSWRCLGGSSREVPRACRNIGA